MSSFGYVILNKVDKHSQNFTCFSSMGGTSVVDYLIGDPISLCIAIFDFSIGNKQPDFDHCHLFFTIDNSLGLRPLAPSSQGQVLHPNLEKENQYIFNIKHKLTYVQARCTPH